MGRHKPCDMAYRGKRKRLTGVNLVEQKTGIDLIAAERQRQITTEGWTAEHDQKHDEGQLIHAAACYLLPTHHATVSWYWPWAWSWWKPSPDDRIRELVKAGALIAAEIDRRLSVAKEDRKDDVQ